MGKCYLVIYKDRSMTIYNGKDALSAQNKEMVLGFYELDDSVTAIEICEFLGRNLEHSKIKKIEI